jgi:peptidoglycan/xylan/chitin deacetylase (PgdA/CDA1 family)
MSRQRSITLTFDNGPTVGVTDRVLDILEWFDIKATFFVVGSKLLDTACRELARRAVREGHWLGNHTYSHRIPLGRINDPGLECGEIEMTDRALSSLYEGRRLFRPFGGGGNLDDRLLSPAAVNYLKAGRFDCVLWTCVPGDWKGLPDWPDIALSEMTDLDNVLVLHDQEVGACDLLDGFIRSALASGFCFTQHFPDRAFLIRDGMADARLQAFVRSRAPCTES